MEDVVLTFNEKLLSHLIYLSMIEKSPEIKTMLEKLTFDNIKDSTILNKYEKCQKEAKKEFDSFKKEIDEQLNKRTPIRIYVDGVFDIMHSGHFNAIRQAKKLGEQLVIGVNSDEEVLKVKGPTLMNIEERSILGGSTKWSDEVAKNTPYAPDLKTLETYNCDFLAHGDDLPINENGDSCYAEIIKANKLRIYKRTEGISTTDITGRLLLTCSDRVKELDLTIQKNKEFKEQYEELTRLTIKNTGTIKNILATSWRISEFSNKKLPKRNDKIVYFCGDFDILQKSHIEALKQVKELGDFNYIGVFSDTTIKKYRGDKFPILNINERIINVLSCKYVNEVIIGAPDKITTDMIQSLNISLVIRFVFKNETRKNVIKFEDNLYEIPKKMGILKEIEFNFDLSNEELVNRIWKDKEIYLKKYLSKVKKEIISLGEITQI